MDVKFEKVGDAAGKIIVNVTEADYADKVTEKLKEIGKKHTIPGFRKGHISLPELRKRFGRDVKSDAINDVVFHEVYDFIQNEKIKVLGQPMPEASQEIDLKKTDYTFTYDVALWPEVDLKLDKSVTLPFYNIKVTDEMIEEQDKALRERFGSQVPGDEVDAKAVIKGSLMELNADGTVKTDEDAIQVVAAIVAPFLFKDKEEADKFMGKHVNDKVVFNPAKSCEGNVAEMASMLNIDKDKAADVKADFEFAISEIIVVKLAEHDQDFFDDVFGKDKVHNEDEYKAAITNMISQALLPNSRSLFSRDVHDYLLKTYGDMKLDEPLVKRWILLNDKDMTAEDVDKNFEAMLPSFKWEILSDEVAEKLGVEVTEDDLNKRAFEIARQQMMQYGMYNMDDETIADMGKRILADAKIRRQIHAQCEESKMFAAVAAAVTLDEKTVTLDEFKKIAEAPAE